MVPTLTGLTPNAGLTAGGALVTAAGTGFRVGVPQRAAFPNRHPYALIPTVLVLFGAVQALEVRVYADGMLTCLPPPATATGPVAVTIINLDDAGVPIPGESVSVAAAYTYTLPEHTREFECDFTRTLRMLIRLLKQQVIAEVNYATQTDYDPTTGDELHVTKFATLPALALVGPDLDENRFYSLNEPPSPDDGTVSPDDGVSPGGFLESRVPYTVDVRFTIIGASNNKAEVLNLLSNFVSFMHANKWLVVNRSGTDPSLGTVRIEMDFAPGGLPKSTTTPNTSNLVSWSSNIVLRGLDITAFSGITDLDAVVQHGQTADTIDLGSVGSVG